MKVYGLFHNTFKSESLIGLYLLEESAIKEKERLGNLPSIWQWREPPEMQVLYEEFAKYPRFKSREDEENQMKTDPHYRSITEQWEVLNKKAAYPYPVYAGEEKELKIKELEVL